MLQSRPRDDGKNVAMTAQDGKKPRILLVEDDSDLSSVVTQ
jgi:hypothetical protein